MQDFCKIAHQCHPCLIFDFAKITQNAHILQQKIKQNAEHHVLNFCKKHMSEN